MHARSGPGEAVAGETDELVGQAQGGHGGAYEALFARVAERLLLYVRLRLGPELSARLEPADVLQEIYLQAHKDFQTFQLREKGSFSGWLYRIADHRLRDLASYFSADKRKALNQAARGSAVLERLTVEERGPATECDRRERHVALAESLTALADLEREALLLRFFHDLTLDAIADRLETSEPTVRRALVRGQVKLGMRLRSLAE
jgi:RNA polymerase sigma-70 factor (ECF subfamily)